MNQQMDQKSESYRADPAAIIVVNVGHADPEATVPLVSRAGPLDQAKLIRGKFTYALIRPELCQ